MSKILQNEETMEKFMQDSNRDFERYKSDRETLRVDEKFAVADGMWRCLQNRSLADNEKRNLMKDEDDDQANVGTVRYFRTVAQKASLMYSVGSSVDVPFKYKTVANPEIWGSAEEAGAQAAIHNVLAKYAWKQGDCSKKFFDFCFADGKYSWVAIQAKMHQEHRRVAVKDPKTKEVKWQDKVVKVFPTFDTIHWSQLYADAYVPDIENQTCVIVLSVVPWMDIQKGVKNKWYDKEAVAELREEITRYKWDGNEGAEARKAQLENANMGQYSPGESEIFLKWDIYRWAPIKGAEYDEEADYELFWCTAIGNNLTSAKPIRMDKDFDPDGEIPIAIVKGIPDDSGLLYGMSWAESARCLYSIEATLMNGIIDNTRDRHWGHTFYDPTMMDSVPKTFGFGKDKKTAVNGDPRNVVFRDVPPDTTQANLQLVQMLQNEQGVATATNQNMMGEAMGGRTSASESLAVNRFSQQPNNAFLSYSLKQLAGFVGRKFKSYAQAFMEDTQIKMIADEELDAPLYKDTDGYKIYGDFDVETDAIDESVDDYVSAGQELQLLGTVSGNEALMASEEHQVHAGEWLKSIFRRLKVHNVDSIVTPAGGVDAKLRQRDEIRHMLETGEYVEPQEGENHRLHISVLNAEILRWKPVLDMKLDPMDEGRAATQTQAANFVTSFLIPHKQAHEAMLQGQGQAAQMEAVGAEQTPGQMAGNEMAGMLGGLQPQ
jgi:hypothetical protein